MVMARKVNKPGRPARRRNVSYALLERFSELLICARCFRNNHRNPVRQILSRHHRPLPLCHKCSHEVLGDRNAEVLHLN
jgi:hypothetical protein